MTTVKKEEQSTGLPAILVEFSEQQHKKEVQSGEKYEIADPRTTRWTPRIQMREPSQRSSEKRSRRTRMIS